MSEIPNTKAKAEIIVVSIKSRKVYTYTGRYGVFYEAYAYCASKGYLLIGYKAIY